MQCADVFEKSKVLGEVRYVTATYKPGEVATFDRANILVDATQKALAKEEIVSFVHVVQIQNKNVIIQNQGEVTPYINKEVRCISNGHKWFVLAKYIESVTDLKVITDEHMFILGTGMKIEGIEKPLKIGKIKK